MSMQTFSLVCFLLILVTWHLKSVDISLFFHRGSLLFWYFISEDSCPLKQGSGVSLISQGYKDVSDLRMEIPSWNFQPPTWNVRVATPTLA